MAWVDSSLPLANGTFYWVRVDDDKQIVVWAEGPDFKLPRLTDEQALTLAEMLRAAVNVKRLLP